MGCHKAKKKGGNVRTYLEFCMIRSNTCSMPLIRSIGTHPLERRETGVTLCEQSVAIQDRNIEKEIYNL